MVFIVILNRSRFDNQYYFSNTNNRASVILVISNNNILAYVGGAGVEGEVS